jgi:UTP--glucose-1-phosphate uridylyltransferase
MQYCLQRINGRREEETLIKKAIIPAAGFGTRSLPITKVIPKEMFPIGVKPAIEYVVEEAFTSGIEQILIIVSRSKNLIVDYFDHSFELEAFLEKKNKTELLEKLTVPDVQILYTRQPYARGLGDAIRLGKGFVGSDPFAVLLPDDIILHPEGSGLKQLIDIYEQQQSSIIGLTEVEPAQLKNYGVIKGRKAASNLYELLDIVEKPKENAPSNLAVIGRYVFTPEIMSCLDGQSPGLGGEVQLTDAIKEMLTKDKCYGAVMGGERYDIGLTADYIRLINTIYQMENH